MNGSELERLRQEHLPATVRLLFIGESPPASGRFFYRRDSGLYRAMREAFQLIDPSIADSMFLKVFRESGCYLFDLCPKPVDRLSATKRRDACRLTEGNLARVIDGLQPAMIATLLRSIESNVLASIATAHWQGSVSHLPYPGRWNRHREAFVRELTPAVVFDIKYHVVWITKYRYKVLTGRVAERTRDLIRQTCESREVMIVRGAVSPDHIHMLLSAPVDIAPSKLVQYLKVRTSRRLQDEFQELRKRYWGQYLWARGCFCATLGAVDEKTIQEYIENQKWDEDDQGFKITAPTKP